MFTETGRLSAAGGKMEKLLYIRDGANLDAGKAGDGEPISKSELRELHGSGELSATHEISFDFYYWFPARKVAELFAFESQNESIVAEVVSTSSQANCIAQTHSTAHSNEEQTTLEMAGAFSALPSSPFGPFEDEDDSFTSGVDLHSVPLDSDTVIVNKDQPYQRRANSPRAPQTSNEDKTNPNRMDLKPADSESRLDFAAFEESELESILSQIAQQTDANAAAFDESINSVLQPTNTLKNPAAATVRPIVWHYSSNGQACGPVLTHQLRELIRTGKVSREDVIWKTGMDDWRPATSIVSFAEAWPQQSMPKMSRNRIGPPNDRLSSRESNQASGSTSELSEKKFLVTLARQTTEISFWIKINSGIFYLVTLIALMVCIATWLGHTQGLPSLELWQSLIFAACGIVAFGIGLVLQTVSKQGTIFQKLQSLNAMEKWMDWQLRLWTLCGITGGAALIAIVILLAYLNVFALT